MLLDLISFSKNFKRRFNRLLFLSMVNQISEIALSNDFFFIEMAYATKLKVNFGEKKITE